MADVRKRFRVRQVSPADLEAALTEADAAGYEPAGQHVGLPLIALPNGELLLVLEDATAAAPALEPSAPPPAPELP